MDISRPRTLIDLEAVIAAEPASGESPEVTALVDRAKTGDSEAFSELMRLYEGRIISIGVQMGLSRDDALDATQDAFVKVFRYIGSFRTGRSFFNWLHRIAIHAIYDHLRRNRPLGTISVEEMSDRQAMRVTDTGTPLQARLESADLVRSLLAGLGSLSRQERIVFVLRDLQEMDTQQIGRVLRLSQVTVRRHCMSARKKLRDRFFGVREH